MGWTSYHAEFYKNGTVDRKAEMDKRWSQEEHDGTDSFGKPIHYPEYKVLKSTMVGRTYYAAIQITNSHENTKLVFAAICLTSVERNKYHNFSYKDMDETCGPYKYDCPANILNLLTETNNEYALEWRKKCRDKLERKRNKRTKETLPVGSIIKYTRWDGVEVSFQKMSPNYQFKRNWWRILGTTTDKYMPSRYIPEDFEIVEVGTDE